MIRSVLLAITLWCVWVFVYPTEARASNTEICVTNGEWASFDLGAKRTDVRKILDGPGHKQGPTVWWYPICNKDQQSHRAVVWYKHGRLQGGVWVVLTNGEFLRAA